MGDASAKPVNLDNEKTGKNEIARKDDTLDADEVIGEFENLPNHERHTVTREITQMMMGLRDKRIQLSRKSHQNILISILMGLSLNCRNHIRKSMNVRFSIF